MEVDTMQIPLYQVDAFTDTVFSGNPAAVCPLARWLPDAVLQSIAGENNLAETAFFVRTYNGFHIRWFTPKTEVNLCGHATLATAFVVFNLLEHQGNAITFQSLGGLLSVSRKGDWFTLNFPADGFTRLEPSTELMSCFDKPAQEVYRGSSDLMFVFASRRDIETISPDLPRIAHLKERGIIATARGSDTDFVSRFFAPAIGINEDPVTGSAHTTLTPYWSKMLNKTELTARQVSERGGFLICKQLGDRVEISGQAVFYLKGEISV